MIELKLDNCESLPPDEFLRLYDEAWADFHAGKIRYINVGIDPRGVFFELDQSPTSKRFYTQAVMGSSRKPD